MPKENENNEESEHKPSEQKAIATFIASSQSKSTRKAGVRQRPALKDQNSVGCQAVHISSPSVTLHCPFQDFVIACHSGCVNKVEKYLNSGKYRPNDKDFFGWTALHAACAGLHFYVIKILLEHDEDPTCTDRRGNSAIQLMILWNRIGKDIYQSYRDILRLMIKKARELYGKNVINKLFDNGETIL